MIAVHKGNDGLWEWWDKRSRSQINDVTIHEDDKDEKLGISFKSHCEYEDGMIIKVPLQSGDPDVLARCDGKRAEHRIRQDFGRYWVYVIVPKGSHTVEISVLGGSL